MRRAVFLDRDGVLNRLVERDGRAVAPRAFSEFTLLPGVSPAVEALRRAALLAIVVTNQPEVARGGLEAAELWRMHDRLRREVRLDGIYTCPHDDLDRCLCRKPKPGLLWRACRKWKIDLRDSFLVGDSWKDIAAGKAAGCATILVGAGRAESAGWRADFSATDLPEAAGIILNELGDRTRPSANQAGGGSQSICCGLKPRGG